MKKAIKWLDDYLEVSLGVVLMSLMTLIIFIQVIARYVLRSSCHGPRSWPGICSFGLFILESAMAVS